MEPRPPFAAEVQHADGGVDVALVGSLDAGAAPTFQRDVWPLVSRYDASQVVLDCSRLASVDADGLAPLLRLARACGPSGGRLTLRHVPPQLQDALDGAGASTAFQIDEAALS